MNELYEFKREDAFRFASAVNAETFEKGNELHFKYCPYCHGGSHNDTKTFAINLLTGAFNCKRSSCDRAGNMITLAQDFENFSLGDGIDDYYSRRERYRRFARTITPIRDGAIEYLKGRGIPEEITRRYEITIKQGKILIFQFIDDEENVWFIKYRNIEHKKGDEGSKEWCEPNRKPILFGMNHCNFANKTLVITEGQIDSLSCTAAGIENAVSVPLGKNGFTWYPYCFQFLNRFDELIVFGDYENGEISLLEAMKTRFNGTVKHVRPEDYKECKDANEILMKYGPDAVRACVENAIDVPVYGLIKMRDVQRIKLSELEWMRTGIEQIDRDCRFVFGELIILTGAAGDGKSTFASQLATMAINQGYTTLIYSGEMPMKQIKEWVTLQIAGRHNLNLHDEIESDVYDKIEAWPEYDKLYVYDEKVENDEETIFKILINGIRQYKVRFIVIDNLMTAMDAANSDALYEKQTKFTKRLANIAQDMNVIIVLVAHPRKSGGGKDSNDDIAGSSNIVNRAHKVVRYSRPKKEFIDKDSVRWSGEDLDECPHRVLTVSKDRITGNTINKGIVLYFEKATKRISDKGIFDWRLGWEVDKDGFAPVDDLDEIAFD